MDEKTFVQFRRLVHDLTGVTINTTRRAMLAARVRSCMTRAGVLDHGAYYRLVREDEAERGRFIDKVTTHETRFFRTPRVWTYLRDVLLPEWFERHPGEEFSAWSAASSTGEESYSLAILMAEFRRLHPGFRCRIHASDISSGVLASCRAGLYGARSVAGLAAFDPALTERYLVRESDQYRVDEQLTASIRFFPHNLFDPPPARRGYDLVLLRNVLIYFKAADQSRVLGNVSDSLKEEGALALGESESLAPDNRHFDALAQPINGLVRRRVAEDTPVDA